MSNIDSAVSTSLQGDGVQFGINLDYSETSEYFMGVIGVKLNKDTFETRKVSFIQKCISMGQNKFSL